jgi:hypothetical protein
VSEPIVRVEEIFCPMGYTCPQVVAVEGQDEDRFMVGKRPSASERELLALGDGLEVVKYPRRSLLRWAAAQGSALAGCGDEEASA